MSEVFYIRLPDRIANQIRDIHEVTGISIKDIITHCLERFLRIDIATEEDLTSYVEIVRQRNATTARTKPRGQQT